MHKSISNAIAFLRFPLACMIVFKHYYTPDISTEKYGGEIYHIIGGLITHVLTAVPVPLFMMISGYLYFSRCENQFNKAAYVKKTKARIKSLLIPYLLWNLMVFLFFSITQFFSGGTDVMQKDGYKMIWDYEFIDFIKIFWALDSTGLPIDGPLWFIRDLFVMSLFSPIFYYGIKYLKWYFVCIISLLYFFNVGISLPFVNYTYNINSVVIFFTIGASFMLLNSEAPVQLKENKFLFVNAFISIVGIVESTYLILDGNKEGLQSFLWVYRVFGAFLLFGIAQMLTERGVKITTWLSTASFFIFAIHKPIQVIIRRLVFALLNPSNEILLISLVVIIPSLVILISISVFYIIRRWLPCLKCLNGYRL